MVRVGSIAMRAIRALRGPLALGAALVLNGCAKESHPQKDPNKVQIRTAAVETLAHQNLCLENAVNPNLRMDFDTTTDDGKPVKLGVAVAKYVIADRNAKQKNVTISITPADLAKKIGPDRHITSFMSPEGKAQTEAYCQEFNPVNRVDRLSPPYYIDLGPTWSEIEAAKPAAEAAAFASKTPVYFKGALIKQTNTGEEAIIVLQGDLTSKEEFKKGEFKIKLDNPAALTINLKSVRYVPKDKPEPLNGVTIADGTIFTFAVTAESLSAPHSRNGKLIHEEKDPGGKLIETELSKEIQRIVVIARGKKPSEPAPAATSAPAPKPVLAPAPEPKPAPAPKPASVPRCTPQEIEDGKCDA
jgi:hypothetical protein